MLSNQYQKVLSRTKYQGSFDVDQKSYGPNVLWIFKQNQIYKNLQYSTKNIFLTDFPRISYCLFTVKYYSYIGFSGGSDGKESTCSAGDPGSIAGSGRSPGEGNDYQLQYSCLENSMDREAWQATYSS